VPAHRDQDCAGPSLMDDVNPCERDDIVLP
jgi:hypothetical protein